MGTAEYLGIPEVSLKDYLKEEEARMAREHFLEQERKKESIELKKGKP